MPDPAINERYRNHLTGSIFQVVSLGEGTTQSPDVLRCVELGSAALSDLQGQAETSRRDPTVDEKSFEQLKADALARPLKVERAWFAHAARRVG